MGAWRPTKATRYESECHDEMKEALSSAIQKRLNNDPEAESTLLKAVSSCRPANIRDYKNGDGALYGMVRLTQTAEALGLRPQITFRKHPHDKTIEPDQAAREPEKPHVQQKIRRYAEPVYSADGCIFDVPQSIDCGPSLRHLRQLDAWTGGALHGCRGRGPADDEESWSFRRDGRRECAQLEEAA